MSFKVPVEELRSNPTNPRACENQVRRLDGSSVVLTDGVRRLHAQLEAVGVAQVELPGGDVIQVMLVADKLQEVVMDNGQGVVSVIVGGGDSDLMCFQSAFRTPHRKIIVIGESPAIREAVKKAGIEATVEFAPAGFQPLPESITIDATKHVKR